MRLTIDYDCLFKELLRTFFVEFLELFFPKVLAYVDTSYLEFLDKEIFTDVTFGEQHELDLVVNWRDFLRQRNPVASALMAKMQIASEDRPRVKAECLRLLVTLQLNPAKMQLISGFIDTYLRLNDREREIFQAQIEQFIPEQQEEVMQIVTSWMEQGIEIGKAEGRAEGRVEGQEAATRSLVLRLLARQVGAIAPASREQIEQLSLVQLEELAEALLDFERPEDLDNWLARCDSPETNSL